MTYPSGAPRLRHHPRLPRMVGGQVRIACGCGRVSWGETFEEAAEDWDRHRREEAVKDVHRMGGFN